MKALVVDDSSYFREQIAEYLKEYNVEIIFAKNGLEAVEKYFKHKPDFVTMDLDMPIENGFNATRKIIEKDKDAKIIVCSTLMGIKPYRDKVYDLGALNTIAKPFTKDEFDVVILELITTFGIK